MLIDDVDRLPPTETALVLKLVRLCSDFPRFVYLLAYDRAVVSESLAKAAAGGAAFLDKIIQVEVPLPRPASEHLQEYLFQGLRKVGEPLGLDFEGTRKQFGLPAEDARLLRVLHQGPELEGLLESLRDVKRLLNAVSATAPLVAGEVNASDFLLLETLRVHFPNDYDHLHQNRYDFATFDRSSGSFGGQRLRRRPEGDPPWPRSRIPPAGRGVDDVPGVVHDCA